MSADCRFYQVGGLSVGGLSFGGLSFGGLSIDCYCVGGLSDNQMQVCRFNADLKSLLQPKNNGYFL